MGYRSDVVIVVYSDSNEVNRKIEELIENTRMLDNGELFDDSFEIRNGVYTFTFNNVKWYADYEEVMVVDKFLSEVEKIEGSNYEKVIVGEEWNDVETVSFGKNIRYMLVVDRKIKIYF